MKLLDEDAATDLKGLSDLLKKGKIKHIFRKHPGATEERILKLIGYYPTGTHQILVEDLDWEMSIIRGFCSYGLFEMLNGGPENNVERTETAEEMVELIKSKLPGETTTYKLKIKKHDKSRI